MGALDRRARERGQRPGHTSSTRPWLEQRGPHRSRADVWRRTRAVTGLLVVGDTGAQLTEHREARTFDQLGAGRAQVIWPGPLLGLKVPGVIVVLQVSVLGAHEAARQRTIARAVGVPPDRRVLGEMTSGAARSSARLRRSRSPSRLVKNASRAGQRHQANERSPPSARAPAPATQSHGPSSTRHTAPTG